MALKSLTRGMVPELALERVAQPDTNIVGMDAQTWTVAEAKLEFSESIEQVKSESPQKVTKHGRTAAVVVAGEQWEQKFRAERPLGGVPSRTSPRQFRAEAQASSLRVRRTLL